MSKTIWELDYYSRPVLDDEGKKLWEVLICESPTNLKRSPDTLFKYAEYCSSKTVNSIWLREAIARAIAKAQTPPQKIRFFRRQMNNMIVKACEDAEIVPLPSRRTYALQNWIEERMERVYPNQTGYDPQAAKSISVQYPVSNAVPLPDAVRGDRSDKWMFVNLEAAAFDEMDEWEIAFEESFSISIADVSPSTKIPGLIIFSPRAIPLAAWMSGLEMGFLKLETDIRPQLQLETGLSDSWILLNLTNRATVEEGKQFEAAKQQANGVHFLAVQSSPDSESFAGFWLMKN
ncbi:Tab2 family RNA-binding protein [Myxosarcina sp. GI1(2024)]